MVPGYAGWFLTYDKRIGIISDHFGIERENPFLKKIFPNPQEDAMNEKEKYCAKIEAQMASFNETLQEITTKEKLRKEKQADIQIKALVKKHEDAKAKLKELENSDENTWQKIQSELDQLVADVDQDTRNALAYFG